MDLGEYFRKLRKVEADIPEESVVVVSRETPDGGRSGMCVDVPRQVAARLIAEGKADQATEEEAAAFRAETERRWKAANELRKT